MSLPANLGTPGARNSRAVTNAGPAIFSVAHNPPAPGANQAAVVTARVHDPDGVASVQLSYRVDPSTNYLTIPMLDSATSTGAVACVRLSTTATHRTAPFATGALPNTARAPAT